MDRLQKKCFVASTGLHLLLAVILFVGPAFLAPRGKVQDVPPLNFVPSLLIDGALQGGGNPNARPPAPLPPTPASPARPPDPPPEPVKAQVKAPEPEPIKEPVKEPVKNNEPDPEAIEPAKSHKPRLPDVSTIPVIRKPTTKDKDKSKSAAEEQRAEERKAAELRRELAGRLAAAAKNIGTGVSGATMIEEFGPGGGGPTYASYAAWVKTVYENAWVPPDDTSIDRGLTTVSITIANDGSVLSHHISKGSGDARVDASVQRTLERVTTIGRPFPEGIKEKQRTYKLQFDLRAKRGTA